MNANRFTEQNQATITPPSTNGKRVARPESSKGVLDPAKPARPSRCSERATQSPSPNGENRGFEDSAPATPSTSPSPNGERDANGRFAKGNLGGPGNPFARQVAELRQAFLDRIDKEKIGKLMDRMYDLAMEGNMQAAKLILSYTIGKPVPMTNPDRVDSDEWDIFKETAPMMHELSSQYSPDPCVPLVMARIKRASQTRDQLGVLHSYLSTPPEEKEQADKLMKRDGAKFLEMARAKYQQHLIDPSTISVVNSPPPSPSPNGKK